MMDWRKSVKIALLLVIFEGAIRKWILPQASDYVYFLKDTVLLVAYAQYFFGHDGKAKFSENPLLTLLFGLNIIIISAQAFNPNLGSPLTGLFGSRSYLIYLPLYFLVGDLFLSYQELQKFLQFYLLLAFPVCLLGIAQFFLPVNSPLNTYAPSAASLEAAQNVASFGTDNHARITGTFPYLAGLGTYTFTWLLLGLGVWLNATTQKWKLILSGALLLLQIDILMSGSRAPVYMAAIAIIIFAVLGLNSRSHKERRSILALGGIAICLAGGVSLIPQATESFLQRASSAGDDPVSRFFAAYVEPLDIMDQAGITGFGAGIAQGGSEALRNAFNLPLPIQSPPAFENESSRVLVELGAIGFIAWYAMRLCLLYLLWKTYRVLRLSFLRQLALLAFLIHALTFGGQLVLNTTAGVYYWLLAGFIILLPRLDRTAYLQNFNKYNLGVRTANTPRL